MQFPRLPGQYRYMAELDVAVKRVLDGANAKEVLESTAEKWRAISTELGADEQKLAYRKSLGISTSSKE